MKNAYALKLQRKKAAEIADAHMAGFQFGCNLIAVGLNVLEGHGAKRLTRLEDWCTETLDKEFGNDPEAAAYAMARRIDQIRNRGKGKKR